MRFTKSLVWIGILAQAACGLAFADGAASANAAAAAAASPEAQLITSMIAASGENLPSDQLRDRMNGAFAHYFAVAPQEGRLERTETALVSLKIDTPLQARTFNAQMQTAAQEFAARKFENSRQAQRAFQAEILSMSASSQGAQFSQCSRDKLITAAIFVTGLTMAIYSNNQWVADIGELAFIGAGIELAMEFSYYNGGAGGCVY